MEDFKQMIKEMNKKEFITDLILGGLVTAVFLKLIPYIIIYLG